MTGDLTNFTVGDGQRAILIEGPDQDAVIRVLTKHPAEHARSQISLEEAERRVEQLLASGQVMLVIVLGDNVVDDSPPGRSIGAMAYHIPMEKPPRE